MPHNFDGADGSWDIYESNDPASIHADEQTRAKAKDAIRNGRSFVVIAVPDDDSEPYAYSSLAITTGSDSELVMKGMAELLVRMWFSEIDESDAMDMVFAALQLKANFSSTIRRYLNAGGEL